MIHNTKSAMTGAQAVAEAMRQINPDVMPIYPITPQTPIIEIFAKIEAQKKVDTEMINVESEHSAMSACVGASSAGARTVTASSSQGLALMNEILYIASGMRLPILMAVSARALSAPLNIHGDHSDVMSVRDAGWIQLFSENAQEAYDNTLIGMKLAEAAKIPVMVIMDGFITSHSVENLEILPDEKAQKFVGEFKSENSLLDTENPQTFGAMALPNTYMDFKIAQDEALCNSVKEYKKITAEYEKISGRKYEFFENYLVDDAEQVIVVAGSTAGTGKEVVDKMRSERKKVGLLKIKLFRPFPHAAIAEVLKNAKSIVVLDRAMSFGTFPPIYQDVLSSMYNVLSIDRENKKSMIHDTRYMIQSYVYGLGGRDIFQKDIENVFDYLIENKISKEIKYIK